VTDDPRFQAALETTRAYKKLLFAVTSAVAHDLSTVPDPSKDLDAINMYDRLVVSHMENVEQAARDYVAAIDRAEEAG
jgi:hypothetical protein